MDREKVIKGLECCIPSRDKEERDNERECRHQDCPYEHFMKGNYGCLWELLTDALALLKEQEAVEPTWQQGKAYCGSCGKRIPLKIGARYCHKCGKAVKWE